MNGNTADGGDNWSDTPGPADQTSSTTPGADQMNDGSQSTPECECPTPEQAIEFD